MINIIKLILPAVFVFLFCPRNSGSITLPVKVNFFYSSTCHECADIKENFLPVMITKYKQKIAVQYLEISDPDNFNMMTRLEKQYGAAIKNPPPAIFLENNLLDGEKEIKEKFENILKDLLVKAEAKPEINKDLPVVKIKKVPKPAPEKIAALQAKTEEKVVKKEVQPENSNAIREKFNYLGFATVVGGGLLDGLNPCAFSTIIILVLYLTFTGYKKIEILKAGLTFTLGIFLAYLLIGVGMLEFARQIKFIPWLNLSINLLFAVIAIVLGFISLFDYYKIKKGKLKEISLQLPERIKTKIKTLIWKKSGRSYHIITSFSIGFFIGILEFPCTGQVYFPIVLAIRELPGLRLHAFSYLLLYNLFFILPLLIVFLLVYMGATSDKLTRFLDERSGTVKILTAILFFILGSVLIFFGLR